MNLRTSITRRRAQLDQVEAAAHESLSRLSFRELEGLVEKWDRDLERARTNRFITITAAEFNLLVKAGFVMMGRYSLDRAEELLGEDSHGLE